MLMSTYFKCTSEYCIARVFWVLWSFLVIVSKHAYGGCLYLETVILCVLLIIQIWEEGIFLQWPFSRVFVLFRPQDSWIKQLLCHVCLSGLSILRLSYFNLCHICFMSLLYVILISCGFSLPSDITLRNRDFSVCGWPSWEIITGCTSHATDSYALIWFSVLFGENFVQ